MGRKRKLFTGTKPIGGPTLKSRRLARVVTSKYHSIRNEQAQVKLSSGLSNVEKEEKIQQLDEELDKLGGTNAYQQASIISTQFFKTSRWVLSTLEQLGRKPSSGSKLNALEVGAINIQLKQCSWLNLRCIDVNSQHPLIEELDFFDLPPAAEYEVVVCSMVVNCVTVPSRRGEMLARLSAQLVPGKGVLLLVLPTRCIESKHIGGSSSFELLLAGLGLTPLLPQRVTPKLIFYTLGKTFVPPGSKKQGKAAVSDGWEQGVRQCIASQMSSEALVRYSRDYSQVPPVEFSVSIPEGLRPAPVGRKAT